MKNKFKIATFAGGCFWCMVKPFDRWDGIKSVISGYTGGHLDNPTYEDVKSDATGHYEAVEITYDPEIISYQDILDVFWMQIDPTDDGGQFHDRGRSYRTAIFYHDDAQKRLALESKKHLDTSGKFLKPIVTEVLSASKFYLAEDYHQNFHTKEKERYEADRAKSGRDDFIKHVWEGQDI